LSNTKLRGPLYKLFNLSFQEIASRHNLEYFFERCANGLNPVNYGEKKPRLPLTF